MENIKIKNTKKNFGKRRILKNKKQKIKLINIFQKIKKEIEE